MAVARCTLACAFLFAGLLDPVHGEAVPKSGTACSLKGEYREYDLQLRPFRTAPGETSGLVLEATAGSARLRLLLDTGATGIIVNSNALRKVPMEHIAGSGITGFRGGDASPAQLAMAGEVAFGPVKFGNCSVQISDRAVLAGTDGVVGPDVFRAFKIRIDAGRMNMKLLPFNDDRQLMARSEPASGEIVLYPAGRLLLVKARVNRGGEGLFVLDTGAAYSVISRELARSLPAGIPVQVVGPCGTQAWGHRLRRTEFQVGDQMLIDSTPIALDLAEMSRREGIVVDGVLGYSALRMARLTIDYRNER